MGEARMKVRTATIALAAYATFATAASACELPDGGKLALKRRPVLGEEAHLATGFGMKLHPILQMMRLHAGIDWAAPVGTTVIAAGDGQVVSADAKGEYGNAIVIDHGSGWQTVYAHLSRIQVREGDCVKADAVIGAVGT